MRLMKRPTRRAPNRKQGTATARVTAPAPARRSRRNARRRPRAEQIERTRNALFRAAIIVVGQYGYPGASIARITTRARVAQGTFYNYFASRQALLDMLLPTMGRQLVDYIRDRVGDEKDEVRREELRLRGFFEFLNENPEFYRILHEAETFAPNGHREHMTNLERGYVRALGRSCERGAMEGYAEADLEVLAYILMAARDYLSMRFARGRNGVAMVPEPVIDAYMKLMRHGLFGGRCDRAK